MIKPFKCLIVDDEPLAIDVIENYLQRFANTETRRSENALDAFRLLKEEKFDLMFLDIEMPMLIRTGSAGICQRSASGDHYYRLPGLCRGKF